MDQRMKCVQYQKNVKLTSSSKERNPFTQSKKSGGAEINCDWRTAQPRRVYGVGGEIKGGCEQEDFLMA
jgi:hypothetical protein